MARNYTTKTYRRRAADRMLKIYEEVVSFLAKRQELMDAGKDPYSIQLPEELRYRRFLCSSIRHYEESQPRTELDMLMVRHLRFFIAEELLAQKELGLSSTTLSMVSCPMDMDWDYRAALLRYDYLSYLLMDFVDNGPLTERAKGDTSIPPTALINSTIFN